MVEPRDVDESIYTTTAVHTPPVTSVTDDTEQALEPEIPIGTYVTLVDATHSWGLAKQGHVGIIKRMHIDSKGKQVFNVDIPSVCNQWEGYASCFKPAKSKGISKDHVLYLFMENQKNKVRSAVEEKENDIRNTKQSLEYMSNRIDMIAEPNLKEYTKQARRVESVEFDDNIVHIITKPITIHFEDRDDGLYEIPMGKYRIDIPFVPHGTESITMYKLDGTTYNGYQHPHVNSSGHCCWGSYDNTIYGLSDQMDIVGLMRICIDFLSTCDADGWYQSVLFWYTGSYDGCRQCASNSCECEHEDWCSDCDNNNDNCECTRCPDSYDRLEDDCFPDRSCMDCAQCVRNLEDEEWQCWYHGRGDGFSTDIGDMTPTPNANHRYRTISEEGTEVPHPNDR